VGRGALDRLCDELFTDPPGRPVIVVSDSNVAPLYGEPLRRRLVDAGLDAHLCTFPAGEAHKTRQTKAALEDRLLELAVGRDTALVAVGGGVTGDIAGFVAATWHRGVPVVQVPTTLLAMADAALGGKTAVDAPGGKNLIGAFHQPLSVWADVSTLATLPADELQAGFSEVVKAAVIADPALFRWLEDESDALLGRDEEALEHAVERCLRIKARVVARDEREAGRRAVLNFGHTVGHAVEAASGYRIRHGHAVAIGMVAEARLAVSASGFPQASVGRLERLLGAFGLPVTWPPQVDLDEAVGATRRDKKARAGRVRYSLPRKIGRMAPGDDVTTVVAESALRSACMQIGA
jgi:3-dehydroquinate synthase